MVAGSSRFPKEAFLWISEVETATSVDDLALSGEFETLDAKIANGLYKILRPPLRSRINIMEIQASKLGKMVNGRQIAFKLYEYFQTTETAGAILSFQDLLAVTLVGNNLVKFVNEWETVLSGLEDMPADKILESLFMKQIEDCTQFSQELALYRMDISQKGTTPSYTRIHAMVMIHIDERRRKRNRDQHQVGVEGRGAAAQNQQQIQKGDCYQWMQSGTCSRGDSCPWHHPDDRGNDRR